MRIGIGIGRWVRRWDGSGWQALPAPAVGASPVLAAGVLRLADILRRRRLDPRARPAVRRGLPRRGRHRRRRRRGQMARPPAAGSTQRPAGDDRARRVRPGRLIVRLGQDLLNLRGIAARRRAVELLERLFAAPRFQ